MKSPDSSTIQTNLNYNNNNNRTLLTGNLSSVDQQQTQQQQQASVVLNSSSLSTQNTNWSKIQALKQRKCELEKLLNEKNLQLQQIQKQESQLIDERCNSEQQNYNLIDRGNSTLRKKVGASHRLLPKNLLNKEDGDIDKLLVDKRIQQEICNTAFRLVNDPNISKSIRRTHKAEYEAAQQKLIAIHHNLSILKKRQIAAVETKTNSLPNSNLITQKTVIPSGPAAVSNNINPITTVNLTKSPSIQHSCPDFNNKLCNIITDNLINNNNSNKHGNSFNSYYITERRNSTSTTAGNSPKLFDENCTYLIDRTVKKNHRNNYDINRLVPGPEVTIENTGSNNSNNCQPTAYNNYFSNNDTIQYQPQQQYKVVDVENYSNNNNNNNHQTNEVIEGGYFSYVNNNNINSINNSNYNNGKYLFKKVSNDAYENSSQNQLQCDDGGFVKLPGNSPALRQNYNLSGILQPGSSASDNQQYHFCVLSEKNFYSPVPNTSTSSRKYNTVDSVSVSPSTVTSMHDQHIGLGGYWRILPNSERVWCPVENMNGLHENNSKIINAFMPTKASSLGNFDVITTKDESVDRISISSMNSETSKKTKEKQWLETSLDGPLIRSKSISSNSNESGTRSIIHPTCNVNSIAVNNQHTLSPTFNTYNPHAITHLHHHSHKYHKYGIRSKLSSQSMSSNSYQRPSMTKLEDQAYLSHSTSILNNSNEKPYNKSSLITIIPSPDLHQYSSQSSSNNPLLIQASAILPEQLSPSGSNSVGNSSKYNTLKSAARSPVIANISKSSDIRIESPKNMTVVQQATFMPYKEITKPFEMSDFYKYSTKFRQKESKQTHPKTHYEPTIPPSLVTDAN